MKDLQPLIEKFSALEITERKDPSLLEIAGCPHKENVWSNVLAFYLAPGREHLLGDLMLRSLLDTAGCNVPVGDPSQIKIKREHTTGTGRRIDIVVSSDTFVLGIENKVNATLYNDLPDYAATLKKLAGTEKKAIGIVLSKYPQHDLAGDFVNVLYADLLPAARKRLESCTDRTDNIYLIFLHDFLNNIENNLNLNIMTDNPELRNFILINENEIIRLFGLYGKFRAYAEQKLRSVCKEMKPEELQKKYSTTDRPLGWKEEFFKIDNTWMVIWTMGPGSAHIRMEAYIEEDYSLMAYLNFEKGKADSEIEKELKEKKLWEKSYENFPDSNANEIASDLQSRLDEVLAYLAERNTDTQL